MVTKMLNICNYFSVLQQTRRYISALYVTGDKAKENYAILAPFMDFEFTLKDNNLERNLAWRRVDLNVQEIKKKYDKYKSMKLEIRQLETRRQEIAKAIKECGTQDTDRISNFKEDGKHVRDQLKSLKNDFYPIEDDFITTFLKLPNYLSDRTPQEHAKVLYRKGPPGNLNTMKNRRNHMEYKGLIDFTGDSTYYLLNDAALFDWEFPHNCARYLLNNNFTLTVNPDFGRSILVEAALMDKTKMHEVEEQIASNKVNLLHLTGGGSLIGFLGYIAKLSVFPSTIPLRLVSTGRSYSKPKNTTLAGLYATNQSNTVQAFIATETNEQADTELDSVLNLIVDIYKELDINFRIEFLPAPDLLMVESLRASIQIYSPVYSRFIEVGHISHYKDFISKRLLFNTRKNKDFVFPNIVAGTIADVTKIIACLLENQKQLKVPRYEKNSVQSFRDFVS